MQHQLETKGAALTLDTLYLQAIAAHELEQPLADCQSQTAATKASRDAAVRLLEGVEYAFQMFCADTNAAVFHLYPQEKLLI